MQLLQLKNNLLEGKVIKGIIVYYSGTGNNYKIAKALWRGMNKVIDADVATIKEVNPKDMGKKFLIKYLYLIDIYGYYRH